MKFKIFISIVIGFTFLQPCSAQVNNNTGKFPDSLELRCYQRLLQYISEDVPLNINLEPENNLDNHLGEEHRLVIPIARGAVTEPTENASWDKSLPSVYNKGPLLGSPFLLSSYKPGLVINQKNSVIDRPDYFYNYDKMSGNFLLKRNNEHPIAVYREQVKYFCIKTNTGGYIFERVPLINPDEFYQVLYKGTKYSGYKMYKSRFVPAGQVTNGYLTEGNNYDEYQDIIAYYLLDQTKGEAVVFELTKKSIRQLFPSQASLVEQYFDNHKWEEVSEAYLVHLLEILNK